MKTRCAYCAWWIVWDRPNGTWWHLDSGKIFCPSGHSIATRDARLPLVDLIESDKDKIIRGLRAEDVRGDL